MREREELGHVRLYIRTSKGGAGGGSGKAAFIKFEVRGILVRWIWLVNDCVITFLPTEARVLTTWHWWTSKNRSDPRSLSLDVLQRIIEQLEAVMKGIEVFGFTTRAVEQWKPFCYGCWHSLANFCACHGGRRKSIVHAVVVSPLEALMLDVHVHVAEICTKMDTSYDFRLPTAWFWVALLPHCLNSLSKAVVATLQGTIKR